MSSLFHQCIAGPIVRYKDVSEQILSRHVDSEVMRNGINRLCLRSGEKGAAGQRLRLSIAARTILSGAAADQAPDLATLQNASALSLWLGVLCLSRCRSIWTSPPTPTWPLAWA